MILKELTVQDFGVYGGEQTLNLTPRDGQGKHLPIILFGGKNGSGKTTVLEAIQLCLFGQLALGNRVRQTDYHKYLAERIHRSPNYLLQSTGSQIRLKFEYVHAGKRTTYEVIRSWDRVGQRIEEDLNIRQDGQSLSDLNPAHWDDFLRDLVPLGLSELFFFDGEKIQRLANQDGDARALAESFRALLGLNLVQRLQNDLNIYISRHPVDRERLDQRQKQIARLQAEQQTVQSQLTETKQQLQDTESEIAAIQARIQNLEQRITAEGGGFAERRAEHQQERAELRHEVIELERSIRDLCAGVLPFALAPSLCRALKQQLQDEERYQRWAASQEILHREFTDVSRQIREPEFWHEVPEQVPRSIQERVAEYITARLEKLTQTPADVQDVRTIHHVSDPERRQLINWIGEALAEAPDQVRVTVKRLEATRSRLEQIESDLRRAPEDEVLAPLIQEINQNQHQLELLLEQADDLQSQIARLEYQREEIERELKRAHQALKEEKSHDSRLELAGKVQLVLDDYLTELTKSKVEELEQAATEYFNRLCRKENLVHHMAISPSDFSVTLFSKDGTIQRSSELSAGERQIYAIALLWALRHVSSRPLPVIIDTPLARLDSDHRRSVVEHYLPNVSHQVIVLSTDTEVDKPLFRMLEPHIARAYHLSYDPVEGKTNYTEGYFWTRRNGQTS